MTPPVDAQSTGAATVFMNVFEIGIAVVHTWLLTMLTDILQKFSVIHTDAESTGAATVSVNVVEIGIAVVHT